MRVTLALGLLLQVGLVVAEPQINEARARYNYQMFCQGCHTHNGVGVRGVPTIAGFIGHFLNTQKGREYLVRVPGSANSVLDDVQLAEVLNWMIINFGEESVAESWRPYQAKEVAEYRKKPLMEVVQYRQELIAELMGLGAK